MGIGLNIPDIALTYYGWVQFMDGHPGLYGTDRQRVEYHDELCRHYGLTKEQTQRVTDHLDKYDDAGSMHIALEKIRKEAANE